MNSISKFGPGLLQTLVSLTMLMTSIISYLVMLKSGYQTNININSLPDFLALKNRLLACGLVQAWKCEIQSEAALVALVLSIIAGIAVCITYLFYKLILCKEYKPLFHPSSETALVIPLVVLSIIAVWAFTLIPFEVVNRSMKYKWLEFSFLGEYWFIPNVLLLSISITSVSIVFEVLAKNNSLGKSI